MLQARMVPRNVCNLAEERTCARSTFVGSAATFLVTVLADAMNRCSQQHDRQRIHGGGLSTTSRFVGQQVKDRDR
jgi:hypothetical protein